MTLNEFQKHAMRTAVYPEIGNNPAYPILGLVGEAGELANQYKKVLRDDGGEISGARRQALLSECGDALWYIAAICHELGYDLATVAQKNVDKLKARQEGGTLQGSGDQR